ncbi:MAG TPA: DUF3108 domain-containing protein [Stellaceae bacterium]|nr:DUF3108 domain-containing protein [Stellaceae bacterium]
MINRVVVLPTVASALLLLAGWSMARAGGSTRVEARFEIFGFAGLHLLTDRTSVEEASDRYVISTDLDTRGLARIFVDLTSRSEVHGQFTRGEPAPSDYRADMQRNGVDRHYGLDYGPDGRVVDLSAPSSSGHPLFVAEHQIRDTVDQLTAFLTVERQLAKRGTCALTVPVFDGAGLYDLRFTDVGRQNLSADAYQKFAGQTQVCDVERDDRVVNPDRDGDTYKHGRIWYAQLIPGDRMVPVRMEFDTAFGAVTAYLAELRGRGVDLHLAGD